MFTEITLITGLRFTWKIAGVKEIKSVEGGYTVEIGDGVYYEIPMTSVLYATYKMPE